MSKMFFDHLVSFERISIIVNKSAATHEERLELWEVVDKMINHQVLNFLFSVLDRKYHKKLASFIHKSPHDSEILTFVSDKTGREIEKELKAKLEEIEDEILKGF